MASQILDVQNEPTVAESGQVAPPATHAEQPLDRPALQACPLPGDCQTEDIQPTLSMPCSWQLAESQYPVHKVICAMASSGLFFIWLKVLLA